MSKALQALHVTSHTTIGIWKGEFPIKNGNCFSVMCSDGQSRRIVNFALENLEEAISRGVSWPIEVKALTDGIAVIHDSRIPDDWYQEGFCEICCPRDLLPVPQRLAHERQIARGERVEGPRDIAIIISKRPTL